MNKAVLKIFVIILVNLYSHITCCQSYYQISGRVKIVIGLSSILPSTSTILQIENSNKLVETDSTGSFRFENLPSGTYLIKIVGSDFKTLDTLITLSNKSIDNLDLLIISNCEINSQIAEIDIKNHKPRLLIFGGIAPIIYWGQEKFEKKYKVKYYDYGDLLPNPDCAKDYNIRIFEYLDKKYGNKWRKEVRKDVVGYNK